MTPEGKARALLAALSLTLSAGSAAAAESHYGRWAIDPQACRTAGDTSETAPLIFTRNAINWFVAFCSVRKTYRAGNTVYLEARCSSEGKTSDIPIVLELSKDTLAVTWGGQRVKDMQRCPADVPPAPADRPKAKPQGDRPLRTGSERYFPVVMNSRSGAVSEVSSVLIE
jgi:hypothetical protein